MKGLLFQSRRVEKRWMRLFDLVVVLYYYFIINILDRLHMWGEEPSSRKAPNIY